MALTHCKTVGCDYYFSVDADVTCPTMMLCAYYFNKTGKKPCKLD